MKKKFKRKEILENKESEVGVKIPIPNLPKNFLWMHVNSGTKIRNVISYALKEFPDQKSIVWSGAGHGIGKAITCAEICKRKNPGLHQITKLRNVKSKNSGEEDKSDIEARNVPEIHILLAKDPLDEKEPGHQSSEDQSGMFSTRRFEKKNSETGLLNKNSDTTEEKDGKEKPSTSKLSNVATAEFAAMGLRTGKKRSHKGQQTAETSSANKNRKKGKTK